jgi:MtN3 and saliva related transmembrane protein
MMSDWSALIGGLAAACTSLSYLPQVIKAWPPNSTAALSWRMLALLTVGLGLWVVYGIWRGDYVIVVALHRGSALRLRACIQGARFKVRERRRSAKFAGLGAVNVYITERPGLLKSKPGLAVR